MKIPTEKRVRTYELTCLVEAELTQDELTVAKDELSKIITSAGGKIKDTQEWGKRELAYTISKAGKKYTQANYLHYIFEAEAEQVAAVNDAANISESIIRHLLVVQE